MVEVFRELLVGARCQLTVAPCDQLVLDVVAVHPGIHSRLGIEGGVSDEAVLHTGWVA